MKILILGSVALPVPPPFQGGTERVAYAQAIGLSNNGHDVTLVAAKGSLVSDHYRLVQIGGGDTVVGSSNAPQEIVESSRKLRSEMAYLTQVLGWMEEHAREFDVVINNMRGGEVLFHQHAQKLTKAYVNVMHLPMFASLADICGQYNTPLISISNAQRRAFPHLNYVGTVYNGVDIADFPFESTSGDYLLMMGSITPHKNQACGIAVAKTLGMKLILAGKIGDPAYYAKEIAPFIDGTNVLHHGELGMAEKVELYKNAKALLFPVLWEEPFGLVMIEAMACGTPVVAFGRGAVLEVVVDGKTGFIVDMQEQMIDAVGKINVIDRAACRGHVENNFTNEKMVDSLEAALRERGGERA
ncbi:MAG: glycosyltransferase family 4 protein [Patescibacteria group bacterium]